MELFERKRSAMVEKRLGPARKTCNEEVKKCWDWDLTHNDWDLWHIKCISIVYQDYIFHHISYLWDLMGGSIHGGSPIAGWFISWKIPIEN